MLMKALQSSAMTFETIVFELVEAANAQSNLYLMVNAARSSVSCFLATSVPGSPDSASQHRLSRGPLYCLLSARDDEVGDDLSILAIAPIKGLPRPNLKKPKSGYGRLKLARP